MSQLELLRHCWYAGCLDPGGAMDAIAALERIAFLLERANAPVYRARAFRRAAESLRRLAPGEVEQRARAGAWSDGRSSVEEMARLARPGTGAAGRAGGRRGQRALTAAC